MKNKVQETESLIKNLFQQIGRFAYFCVLPTVFSIICRPFSTTLCLHGYTFIVADSVSSQLSTVGTTEMHQSY